jgi:hypothetical protein
MTVSTNVIMAMAPRPKDNDYHCPNAGRPCSCGRVHSAWHHSHNEACAPMDQACNHTSHGGAALSPDKEVSEGKPK